MIKIGKTSGSRKSHNHNKASKTRLYPTPGLSPSADKSIIVGKKIDNDEGLDLSQEIAEVKRNLILYFSQVDICFET